MENNISTEEIMNGSVKNSSELEKSPISSTEEIINGDLNLKQNSKKTLPKRILWIQYQEIIKNLRKKYPAAFTPPPKPLSLSIDLELKETGIYSRTLLKKFLKIYCNSKAYKASLILDAERVDLTGKVTSLVTPEELSKDRSKSLNPQIN